MARPPRRSARPRLKLFLLINNFCAIILLFSILQEQIIGIISNSNLDLNLSQQQQQRKFGDRLSPRHRQINSTIIKTNNIKFKSILDLNNNNNNNNENSVKIDKNNNNYNNSFYENINSELLLNSSYRYSLIKNNNFNINLNNNNKDNNNNNNNNNILTSSVVDDDVNNVALPVKQRQDSQHHLNQLLNRKQRQQHLLMVVKNSDNIEELQQENIQDQKLRRHDSDITKIDHIDHIHFNISKADRLIEMSTEFFIVPTQNPPLQHNLRGIGGGGGGGGGNVGGGQQHHIITPRPVLILASRTPPPPPPNLSSGSTTPIIISTAAHLSSGLRKEAWVIPVLVFAALSMTMMAAFEIFVLFKAWRTSPSRRHLFLGQMLLLGLFTCSGLGAVITATPTVLSCATLRFGIGVAYALVFAALLVKCVFLISLNGGVYLPAPYQGLLLLFAVLIQFAIGAQWLMTQPPEIQHLNIPYGHNNGGISQNNQHNSGKFSMLITSADIQHRLHGTQIILCKTQFSELLFSLIYIFFLIIFVAILAIKSRGIRDNYREATYIGLAIGGAIPIWLGWTLCGLAVADRHKDACTAFGLVATSATVFLVMFMPKGRQLAAMGKEGLYVEDREEQFSSLSRAGSGYSPSFFHFKPIKYGVMGPVPNSGSGGGGGIGGVNGNNNNNSTKQGANLGGGDRVALVTAAPPTYTRMYHYFPAHMTHPFCFYPQLQPPQSTQLTQPLPPLPQLKAIGSSLASTPAQIAQTLRYPGIFMRPDEANLYTTLEPTLSSNPNVFFQRSGGVHPGMMY